MAEKRGHDEGSSRPAKKAKKGFQIGPANLPDGTHKRKVKKIKENIIYKAKLKKQYAKLKAREEDAEEGSRKSVYDREAELNADDDHDDAAEPVPEATLEPHPDRVKMLEEPEKEAPTFERRQRRTRQDPFQKEAEIARKKKEQAEARQKAREEADRERTKKIAERERFRKAMAKARGGPNGQRKLGRESKVLLEKAQRLMGKS
ncbi:hypothetical protein E8E13_001336 [Curvularia kusanoi]|uniref:rRNA-processing protein FYV7 n=1 Tax=Curvularia kusanoi TaxID=90978 RepID=A0A9P4W7U0_CURKU|nr:hypothetical protein E8E13_001336 [Curvularia kusanoi]